jgi:hypothetical protein
MVFSDREKAEKLDYLIAKHGIAIFDAAGLDQAKDALPTVTFNRELRLLDLPDARWSRYPGAGGMEYPHPITVPVQAALLRRKPNMVASRTCWPEGKRVRGAAFRGYVRGDFETALRKHDARAAARLRLVKD